MNCDGVETLWRTGGRENENGYHIPLIKMKETHIFYMPELQSGPLGQPFGELPKEEAAHAVRVLRMREGDELTLTDGRGMFAQATVTMASSKHCCFEVAHSWADHKLWNGGIHLAVAPTKNMDRMEWLAEKATEIGIDRLALLDCANSERRVVKTERLEKIVVAAMKQSHKAFKPEVQEMTDFRKFIALPFEGQRFIAHCHTPEELGGDVQSLHLTAENFLADLLDPQGNALVMIGPEGDFSVDEVNAAVKAGFRPVSLGESRLRTETAALVAVHLMWLAKRHRSNA